MKPICPKCGDTLVYHQTTKEIFVIDDITKGQTDLRYLQLSWPHDEGVIHCRKCDFNVLDTDEGREQLVKLLKEKKDEDRVRPPQR